MSDHHGPGAGLPNETYINTKAVVLLVFVTSLLVIPPMILGAYGYFRLLSQEITIEAVYKVPPAEFLESDAEWTKQNSSYGVVDKAKGIYRVPVNTAKALYVKDVEARLVAEAAAMKAAESDEVEAGENSGELTE